MTNCKSSPADVRKRYLCVNASREVGNEGERVSASQIASAGREEVSLSVVVSAAENCVHCTTNKSTERLGTSESHF